MGTPALTSDLSPGALSPLNAAAAAAAAAGRVALSGHSGSSGVLLASNLNEEVSTVLPTFPSRHGPNPSHTPNTHALVSIVLFPSLFLSLALSASS